MLSAQKYQSSPRKDRPMNDRQHIKTTVQESIDYWSRHVNECGLSVDWSEAETHCWRCGCKRNLELCHIVPHALGGKDEPSNIVLLCHRCHAEGPNVNDPEIMWDWLKAYGVSYYGTFWKIVGMKEYRFIYRHSALEEAEAILESAGIPVDSPLAQSFSTTISIGQPKKQVFTTDSHISTQPRWRAYSAWLSRKWRRPLALIFLRCRKSGTLHTNHGGAS